MMVDCGVCPKCKGSRYQYEESYDPVYPCDTCGGVGRVYEPMANDEGIMDKIKFDATVESFRKDAELPAYRQTGNSDDDYMAGFVSACKSAVPAFEYALKRIAELEDGLAQVFAAHLAIVEAMRTGDAGTLAQANAEYERVYRECQALVGSEVE